jgi:hypothetical protein
MAGVQHIPSTEHVSWFVSAEPITTFSHDPRRVTPFIRCRLQEWREISRKGLENLKVVAAWYSRRHGGNHLE